MKAEQEKQLITETLDDMLGHEFSYGGRRHRIRKYKIDEEKERVYVETNLDHYDRPLEAAMAFLNKFEPIVPGAITKRVPDLPDNRPFDMPVMQIDSTVVSQLKDVLLDNIKKVKENKEYIPQAAAVKDSVNSIIELAKVEVSYIQSYVRLKKNDNY